MVLRDGRKDVPVTCSVRPPPASTLPIRYEGLSARPHGSSRSMLHETVAAREAVCGPYDSPRLAVVASGLSGCGHVYYRRLRLPISSTSYSVRAFAERLSKDRAFRAKSV